MTDPELSVEISEHEKWLKEYGINLNVKCFNQDLKLKCTNFREMHRLFEKYPFFKGRTDDGMLRNPVKIDNWKMSTKHGYCQMYLGERDGFGGCIYFCNRIRFDTNSFISFEQAYNRHTRYVEEKKKNIKIF